MSILTATVLATATAHAAPLLVTPGLHSTDDLRGLDSALREDGWYALTDRDGAFQLVPTSIELNRLPHPLNEAAALQIDATVDGDVRFLVHGVPTAQPGPVPTTYAGARTLVPGTWQTVGYSPEASLLLVASDEDGHTDAELVDLHSPAHLLVQQVRHAPSEDSRRIANTIQDLGPVQGTARLLWAGDLDGDQVTDLLLDETGLDGVIRARLWLSSEAEEGGIVAEAAVFETTGC